MSNQIKNPAEYGYVGDEIIPITAVDYARLRGAIEAFLGKETTVSYPEKYKYVNRETGEVIKAVTDKNKHLAKKIVDVDSTLNSNAVITRTAEGVELLQIKLLLEGIHIQMVNDGVAKHKSFFEDKKTPTMDVVKDDATESQTEPEVNVDSDVQEVEANLGETLESTEE